MASKSHDLEIESQHYDTLNYNYEIRNCKLRHITKSN